MDPTDPRHSGTAHLVVRATLADDELLSSWLVRAALANGCDPLVLTGAIWPDWRAWTIDIDRNPPERRLTTLQQASGIAQDRLRAATLRPVAARVMGREPPARGLLPWIVPAGARNRRRHGALQYCGACLATDAQPYFRLSWRLAWHTACAIHGSLLADRCPTCGAPVEPHRLNAQARCLATCATCHASLLEAPTAATPRQALLFQKTADDAVAVGQAVAHGQLTGTPHWFACARAHAGLVRRMQRADPAFGLARAGQMLGVADAAGTEDAASDLAFEMLPTEERAAIVSHVQRLLQVPQAAFAEALEVTSVTRQGFCPQAGELAPPLATIAASLVDHPVPRGRKFTACRPSQPCTPNTRRTVERMMVRLRRKLRRARA